MKQDAPKESCRRRRSLLVGLLAVLFISSMAFASECFRYRLSAITLAEIRRSPVSDSAEFPVDQAIDQVEAARFRTLLSMGTHASVILIIFWCVCDVVRISRTAANTSLCQDTASGDKPIRDIRGI